MFGTLIGMGISAALMIAMEKGPKIYKEYKHDKELKEFQEETKETELEMVLREKANALAEKQRQEWCNTEDA